MLDGGSFNDFYPAFLTMYSKIIIPLTITSFIGMIITYLVSPVFKSLFYLDLKVRKKEIVTEPGEPSEEYVTAEELGEDKEKSEGEQQ